MPSPALKKSDLDIVAPSPATQRFWASRDGAPAGSNRVGDMQRQLEGRLLDQREAGKWSSRRTLAFIVGTCGVFWGLVAAAAVALT